MQKAQLRNHATTPPKLRRFDRTSRVATLLRFNPTSCNASLQVAMFPYDVVMYLHDILMLRMEGLDVEQTRGQRQTGRNDLPGKGERVA